MRLLSYFVLGTFLGCIAAAAQTIYPVNRADILAGSKFDLKIEFPQGTAAEPIAADKLKVSINGRDAAEVLGKAPVVMVKEDDLPQTSYWIRDVVLPSPGTYVVEATSGGATSKVTWEVYGTKERRAKNVILFIGDGMSVAHRTAARILSKGMVEGKYGGELAMDDMPAMALVSTAGTDSVITDSANSMSAYTTGHKTCNNALGVYCARNKSVLGHPRVEVLSTLVQRVHGMAIGVVTNSEIEDATPAGMVSQIRDRRAYNDIVRMFYDVAPDVIMGGGTPNFMPKSAPGSKRSDEDDYIKKFIDKGYKFVATATEMKAAAAEGGTNKVLGLFNPGNIDGALDLFVLKKGTVPRYPDQPDLVAQTKAALEILSRSPKGFVLMVESSRIDKYSHSLDWERAVFDTIMLDNAVKVAKDFAGTRDDTLIIVVPDHAHPVSLVGVFDDERPGQLPRDKLGTYAAAKFPNYPPPNADGYPSTVDVSRRLAVMFGAYPDHCYSGKPYIEGEFVPAIKGPDDKTALANEANCTPKTARLFGNLPFEALSGVHSGDDVILTAMGPGSEILRGRIDNTVVFRAMAQALGLAPR
jgi:alkaline phosphatase